MYSTNTQGLPRPSKTQSHPIWSDEDIAAVAFRCRALGATEHDTLALLTTFDELGVNRLRAYVDHVPDRDLMAAIEGAEARLRSKSRGVMVLRTPKRWPWRISTNQTFGGVVA